VTDSLLTKDYQTILLKMNSYLVSQSLQVSPFYKLEKNVGLSKLSVSEEGEDSVHAFGDKTEGCLPMVSISMPEKPKAESPENSKLFHNKLKIVQFEGAGN
jgi:hypothetical protein